MIRDPFAERAEVLSDEEVEQSFRATPVDKELLAKLLDQSTRVIIGARGSGKSMLMRRALLSARLDNAQPMCIYVNFQKYLRLEPLVYKSPSAIRLFKDWVISKIFIAIIEEASSDSDALKCVIDASGLRSSDIDLLKRFVETLEGSVIGFSPVQSGLVPDISVERIILTIEALRHYKGRERTVLLMDDAAHAFSPEFQEEFFDVFRLFRTPTLALKAAVYPGATHYGPTFNLGHDALETRVERELVTKDYESFISGILQARLSKDAFSRLSADSEMFTILCYAASGNPRAAIVMARDILENVPKSVPQRADYRYAIDAYCHYVWKQHDSLKRRLPRLESQVVTGEIFVHKHLVPALRHFNEKNRDRQSPYFAVEEGSDPEFLKILALLEYAGIVQRSRRVVVRRGLSRPLMRYQVNMAVALAEGVFVGSQGATVPVSAAQLRKLRLGRYKMYTQDSRQVESLLKATRPALPPCPKCGKPRLVADARFCSYCGAELMEASVYLELLNAPVSALPMPEKKIKALEEQGITTIKDILLDTEGKRILKARSVGTRWAGRIRKMAEEFIEG